ncbi:SDR family NAD(P)-dependent oxidoreductase [Fictibacillus terranigra]|uniref:SDR family NAD(P)-dependent oxidoreductase n=1 Tax=Fictibacillus terranigra TaxID=3058424 RepID=A0ABT8E1V3_9BACL|nr:SDR family NAD(P)-dependent oxidoreductase [Fictibacillus sp. CENA-BCM004]MDN4071900.1 SDR family NAD(P)-dependent oxidoreductase [Fictibacillus sp. CENA-BCM004]
MKLYTKTALVTGAGSGIGEAIAKRLSEEGAYVVIGGKKSSGRHQCWQRVAAEFTSVDVTKQADMKRVVERAAETFGTLDILVNNAGVGKAGAREQMRCASRSAGWERLKSSFITGSHLWRMAA